MTKCQNINKHQSKAVSKEKSTISEIVLKYFLHVS